MLGEVLGSGELDTTPLVELIEPCLRQPSQGGKLGPILGGLLLEEPETGSHHLAGVAIPPSFDLLVDENIERIRQIHVPRRHESLLEKTPPYFA